jgi:hypothetical protein
MLIDTIGNELSHEQHDNCDKTLKETAAGRILASTHYIYMMANQVAFLDLSTFRNYPRRLGGSPTDAVRERFAECWTRAKLKSPVFLKSNGNQPAQQEEQVVAFSDPNNILTWRVERRNLGFPPGPRSNSRTFTCPTVNSVFRLCFPTRRPPHNGYLDNRTVMELMVCGMSNGAVDACLPNGLP